MDPDKINLENLSKNFEYFKVSSEIDDIDCLDTLRKVAKSYIKLYFKQQEVILSIGDSFKSFGLDEV